MNVDDLADFPSRVGELIEGVFDANVRVMPGEWGVAEHLCHLRDIETEGYAVRIEQLLREDDPLLRDLDGDRLAVERRYAEQNAHDALRAFAEARARSVALLREADESALAREGTFENV